MKFLVRRTSMGFVTHGSEDDVAPCAGAERGEPEADCDMACWYIEISSLEELLNLIESSGGKVIVWTGAEPRIEVYDSYRE